jgi:hypothetical protein
MVRVERRGVWEGRRVRRGEGVREWRRDER